MHPLDLDHDMGVGLIDVVHLGNPSHTDGDALIYFRDSNVIHTGDQYVNLNGYPYIDRDVGG